jgi:hypothetical protein
VFGHHGWSVRNWVVNTATKSIGFGTVLCQSARAHNHIRIIGDENIMACTVHS